MYRGRRRDETGEFIGFVVSCRPKVYRKAAEDAAARWGQRALPTLPAYRDYPEEIADYDDKVSSVSRHYVAGNSTPIESESPATEAVRASLGNVALHWTDVVAKQGETFKLMLSVDNSMNLSPEGMAIEIEYDHAVLNTNRAGDAC